MLKCNRCKRYFDDDEVQTYLKDLGKRYGRQMKEVIYFCPYCGNDKLEILPDEEEDV